MEHQQLIEVKSSPFGKGLFAKKIIAPGTVVCNITGHSLTFKETLVLGERESHSLQIGKDKYILCSAPFLYSNHACNPNCAINDKLQFYTLNVIMPGEELLWDYSTSMLEKHWTMQCMCGADNCRKTITDFDLLPLEIQHEYLQRKIVMPFILQHIKQIIKAHKQRA